MRLLLLGSATALLLPYLRAQDTPPAAAAEKSDTASTTTPPPAAKQPTPADFDDLYNLGRQLFDDYAPEAIKDQYEFVSKDQWDNFTGRLQTSLESGSVADLASLESEARRTLAALRMMPAYAEYADWLAERLDLMETARLVTRFPAPPRVLLPVPKDTPDAPAITPPTPTTPPAVAFAAPPRSPVPFYDIWHERIRTRPRPAKADELMPVLKVIFAAEGIPTELVWLAEVESSLNPSARSPAGARGLFQLMPATARAFGLSTFPFDERTQPGKSARAAAKFLRVLHERFDSWPLALAAYNAGEGRIATAQKKAGSPDYADIADLLPSETRMYVPKVLATLAVREKTLPAALTVPLTPAPVTSGRSSLFPSAFATDE
ncbi:lytic transglycosylase domain-containing protein [Nibricoccus aquaticus]|uniref:lytic transglycosylase domain-containing protein n=1 Tax=Nibricoccus aquaticus TaxID=2576891 RepID=UPI0015862EF3|nr:lytic transglycosylase domain-containing protein [Nibricoccus aquaticus]